MVTFRGDKVELEDGDEIVLGTNSDFKMRFNASQDRLEFVDDGGNTSFLNSGESGDLLVTGADHGDLSGLADDDHTQYLLVDGSRALTGALDTGGNDIEDGGTTIWNASGPFIPVARLEADGITVTPGKGLKGGDTVTLGGTIIHDIEPNDFAGLFLSDDGSDNLKADIGTGLENDGSDNIRVTEQYVEDIARSQTTTKKDKFYYSDIDYTNTNSLSEQINYAGVDLIEGDVIGGLQIYTTDSNTADVQVGIYSDTNGKPDSLLASSNIVSRTTPAGDFDEISLSSNWTVPSSGRYWVAWLDASGSNAKRATSQINGGVDSGDTLFHPVLVESRTVSNGLPSTAGGSTTLSAPNYRPPWIAAVLA